jgi:TBC1 domain family member 15
MIVSKSEIKRGIVLFVLYLLGLFLCSEEYFRLKRQWMSISAEQESHFAKYRSRKHRIEKDVVRTDRSYPVYSDESGSGLQHLQVLIYPSIKLLLSNFGFLQNILLSYSFFNFDLGYVQGMSDLLSPILVVMQDEVDAYWCFKGLMDKMVC